MFIYNPLNSSFYRRKCARAFGVLRLKVEEELNYFTRFRWKLAICLVYLVTYTYYASSIRCHLLLKTMEDFPIL